MNNHKYSWRRVEEAKHFPHVKAIFKTMITIIAFVAMLVLFMLFVKGL